MSIWKTLGLDGATEDLKTIKRAYAAKLKITRPEDDAHAFMALREAFAQAKRHAEYASQSVPLYSDETRLDLKAPDDAVPDQAASNLSNIEDISEDRFDDNHREDVALPKPEAPPQLRDVDVLLSRAEGLLDNSAEREKDENWATIFRDVNELAIDDHTEFGHAIRHMFLNRTNYWNNDDSPISAFKINQTLARKIFATLDWLEPAGNAYFDDEILYLQRHLTPDFLKNSDLKAAKPMGKSNVYWFLVIAAFLILLGWVSETAEERNRRNAQPHIRDILGNPDDMQLDLNRTLNGYQILDEDTGNVRPMTIDEINERLGRRIQSGDNPQDLIRKLQGFEPEKTLETPETPPPTAPPDE